MRRKLSRNARLYNVFEGNTVYLSGIDKNVIYFVAGFIARSVKKRIKCKDCANVLGNNAEIRMGLNRIATKDCQYFPLTWSTEVVL